MGSLVLVLKKGLAVLLNNSFNSALSSVFAFSVELKATDSFSFIEIKDANTEKWSEPENLAANNMNKR